MCVRGFECRMVQGNTLVRHDDASPCQASLLVEIV